jgi:hypothetical protein
MSCDISTFCSAIVDLAVYSGPGIEPVDYTTARETDVERDKPPKRGRLGPTADQCSSRIIPDTTHICPQYVWGDEGPVND